ncbi:hypothetical protein PSI19_10510 [Xenorhabdus khoisanae]|uniref:hypothetical protein n=1 Tax=Xenorhabdus khoisanae TaxID=880157 RepID=UPI0023583E3A|nr:hypothetical protein [Xenorhabdus khoisanae]MDC9614295.1 hypothetical protein [Xenorhabdus khoisanae]
MKKELSKLSANKKGNAYEEKRYMTITSADPVRFLVKEVYNFVKFDRPRGEGGGDGRDSPE